MNIFEQINVASGETAMLPLSALSADAGHHVCTEVAALEENAFDAPFWIDEGMTLWAWPSSVSSDSALALLAWDWVASKSGIVARRTLACCYSNITLVGPERLPLAQPMYSLMFATVIHALPWQAEVQRELAKIRTLNA